MDKNFYLLDKFFSSMPGPLLRLWLVTILTVNSVLVSTAACRRLDFQSPLENIALDGHVIETGSVASEEICQVRCYLQKRCASYNVGPQINGVSVCEISDSDDVMHSGDMKSRQGFLFRAAQVEAMRELLNVMSEPSKKSILCWYWYYHYHCCCSCCCCYYTTTTAAAAAAATTLLLLLLLLLLHYYYCCCCCYYYLLLLLCDHEAPSPPSPLHRW